MEQFLGKSIIPFDELMWRFGVASAFGLLLGLDREVRGISAGVRTHMLVALSSAMTMLIALELYEEVTVSGKGDPDPTRASRDWHRRSGSCVLASSSLRGAASTE